MALPQKAIEQLGREPVRTPGWSNGILMFTGTLFFLSLAILLGVLFGYKPYLTSRLKKVEAEIGIFTKKTPLKEQEKLIRFYSQIKNLREKLDNQKFVSVVLPWLEEHTQVNVAYSSFGFNLAKYQVDVSGEAKTVSDLFEQLAVFEGIPDITSVNFSGTAQNKIGNWTFSITLVFDPKFLGRSEIVSETP